MNSKWIKDLDIRFEAKYIKVNIDTKLMDLSLRKDFINLAQKPKEINTKVNEWHYIKIKSFGKAKTKTQTHTYTSIKGLIFKTM